MSHETQRPALALVSLVRVVYLLVLVLFLWSLLMSLITQVLMKIQGTAT